MTIVAFPFTVVANHMAFTLTNIGLRAHLGTIACQTASVAYAYAMISASRAAALALWESSLQRGSRPIPLTGYKLRLRYSKEQVKLCCDLQILGTLMLFPGVLLIITEIFSSPGFMKLVYILGGIYALWSGTAGMFRIAFPEDCQSSRFSWTPILLSSPRTGYFVGEFEQDKDVERI